MSLLPGTKLGYEPLRCVPWTEISCSSKATLEPVVQMGDETENYMTRFHEGQHDIPNESLDPVAQDF